MAAQKKPSTLAPLPAVRIKGPKTNGAHPVHDRQANAPAKILSIDIGGTKVKTLALGQSEPRRLPSGRRFTPSKMVDSIRALTSDWKYDVISIGYPGLVGNNGPRSEPGNLGRGWVGFDFAAAFGMPVRMINDASMQALGSYDGGRMLFLGLGTGLGSALISQNVVISLELGQLLSGDGQSYGERLGRKGLRASGKKKWRQLVAETVQVFAGAFVVDYVVLGGGNSKEIKVLPPTARLGHNLTAFRGGFRLWNFEDVQTHHPDSAHEMKAEEFPSEWRVL